ncbi:hypothetical protein [Candidatus Formimonas warabiya]|uniref:Uncharacterized protein n=1 Tax=Formimonas warabiya TaxID=1761012 RepID=A0A3G1KSR6_FORW1|nr:hypothetical protein [Candidatus Formimonas warabiya]ATW25498.1 hypothetical protein DCMF_12575 [Candidatus Formimonas warabiya]
MLIIRIKFSRPKLWKYLGLILMVMLCTTVLGRYYLSLLDRDLEANDDANHHGMLAADSRR